MKTEKMEFKNLNIDRLLVRILSNRADRKEIISFFQWISEEENRKYFEKFKKIWHLTSGIHANGRLLEIGLEDYRLFMEKSLRRKRQLRRVLWQVAAVIVIGLIGVVSVIWLHRDTMPEKMVKVGRDKAVVLTLSDGREIDVMQDSLLAIKEIGTSAQLHTINQRRIVYERQDTSGFIDSAELIYHEISVRAGERFFVQLSDGTKVWLNSESSLRYPVCFSNVNREVEVQGNLYFEVVKDSTRPFIVVAQEIKTEVLGTSFEVNTYGDKDEVSTTLMEGCVRVYAGNCIETIYPDQKFLFHTNSGKFEILKVDAANKVRWKDGVLVIDNESFDNLVRKLERWYGIDIQNNTGVVFTQSFSGEFDRENVQHAIETICENLNISYSMEKGRIFLSR
ncbi:FecR family protein [Gabonibacter chumensis]|uniref:FecR family protein n=1 Tax=Gabonibacter chumensis TaxID=2972474 RepID=UPI002572DE03|nr:FecR family protein [Gabonibacter chumensis]MCR9012500.1 FecR domain-containing protein [Gabonibacter chumensis]